MEKAPNTGPSLETYVETRFNLLTESINEKMNAHGIMLRAFQDEARAAQLASDVRYQQRFEAQTAAVAAAFLAQETAMKTALAAAKEAVVSALAAADRAVQKAENSSDKRFEGVNEFRAQLADQQRTFMPRAESEAIERSLSNKLAVVEKTLSDRLLTIDKQLLARMSESAGVKGGYGYAVGIVSFVLMILALIGWLVTQFG